MRTRALLHDEIIGARTSIMCVTCSIKLTTTTAIKWNPKNNTFAAGGNPAWLTREYRGEFRSDLGQAQRTHNLSNTEREFVSVFFCLLLAKSRK